MTIGSIGVSDLIVDAIGPLLASTRLGCLVRPDRVGASVWLGCLPGRRLADEDRCHLAGVTADPDGQIWVACAGRTDTPAGGVSGASGGGCVVGADATILATGLTLPVAPRIVDGALVVADSGTGALLSIERRSGETSMVRAWRSACSALAVHGQWAVVGLSAPVGSEFADLPAFADGRVSTCDALALVNLITGEVEGTIALHGRGVGITSIAVYHGQPLALPGFTPRRDGSHDGHRRLTRISMIGSCRLKQTCVVCPDPSHSI